MRHVEFVAFYSESGVFKRLLSSTKCFWMTLHKLFLKENHLPIGISLHFQPKQCLNVNATVFLLLRSIKFCTGKSTCNCHFRKRSRFRRLLEERRAGRKAV